MFARPAQFRKLEGPNYQHKFAAGRKSLFHFQWRTKCSWGVHSVAYGGYLYLACAVCDVTIWRNIDVSKPTFWPSLLTQYAYSSTRTLRILCVIALNINYQGSKLGYRRKIHTTLRHSSS